MMAALKMLPNVIIGLDEFIDLCILSIGHYITYMSKLLGYIEQYVDL